MTSIAGIYRQRSKDWKAVFWVGVLSFVAAGFNFSSRSPSSPTSTPAPFVPAVVPPSPAVTAVQQWPPVSPAKIIQSLPPAAFANEVAPTSIPELEGIERPSPAKKRPPPEFGVKHGYVVPADPQPENVR